ncbi:protein detoxification 16 [Quercus suber]|uniref:Protein detoxification 16 n=1 Tax=Quercus suber TaxID=58331 RepID=A0AAW0KSU2_QUESU
MAKEVENMSLNSPLIQISKENGLSYDRERSSEKISQRNEFFVEMKKQLWLVGPLINVNLLLYFLPLQVIFLMFVGHPGELALSGASMATSFASVSSFSILAHVVLLVDPKLVLVLSLGDESLSSSAKHVSVANAM